MAFVRRVPPADIGHAMADLLYGDVPRTPTRLGLRSGGGRAQGLIVWGRPGHRILVLRHAVDVNSHVNALSAAAASSAVEAAVLDAGRLAAVERSGLLDSAEQDSWDGLTALAVRLLKAPMAFLTVVDAERSFWLATCGVNTSPPGSR